MPASSIVVVWLLSPVASSPSEESPEPAPVEAAEPIAEAPTDADGSTSDEAVAASEPAPAPEPEPAPEPAPAPEAVAPSPDPAPAPSHLPAPSSNPPVAPHDPEPSGPSLARPSRRGPLVGLGLGYVGCLTNACRDESSAGGWRYRGGALGQLEFGYRAGWIAPSVAIDMGGGPMKYTGDLAGVEGTMRFLDVGAGIMAFPMKKGRFDPFVGLRFGYARAREHFTVPGADFEGDLVYSRYGLRLSVGLGIYVLPTLAIGPRFDLTLPVSGHVCGGTRDGEQTNTQCFDASSFSSGARFELPRWWSLSFGMHVVLPRRGSGTASRAR